MEKISDTPVNILNEKQVKDIVRDELNEYGYRISQLILEAYSAWKRQNDNPK